jgi:hypothetical protein
MKINLHSMSVQAKAILSLLMFILFTGASLAAQTDSPSELLEKGIYSEETKGDLDSAMALYQQVLTQGKNTQALAAQAQYRLGVCQYKKRNYTEATAAFTAVTKDYPDQKDLVALAREYLARNNDLLPAPWADGEEERFDVKLAGGLKIGLGVWTADAGLTNGQKIWRVGRLMMAGGGAQFSKVEVDADTMKPIHSRWKHTLLSDADATYLPGHADVKVAGKDEVKNIPLSDLVYDNEEEFHLFRRLPLAPGYKATVNNCSSLAGGEVLPLPLEVIGTETVTVPAGTYPCYKLNLHIGQVFWMSTNLPHEVVKFEGGGVIAELTGVRRRNPADAVKYADPAGFSFTAPAGWLVGCLSHENNSTKVALLDPEMIGTMVLDWSALDSIEPKSATNSARALLEKENADGARTYKNYVVRPDSWQEHPVAGLPAASSVADYAGDDKPRVGYGVTVMAGDHAAAFQFLMPAADFEAMRPRLDAILDTFKVK